MRFQFVGRVVGHELVEGDKPQSSTDAMKVKLVLLPVQDTPGKPGRATFTMPASTATRDFPLRRTLTVTCEECQRELFDAMAGGEVDGLATRRRPGLEQTEIGLPVGDSPIAEPPQGKVTPITAGARRGRRRGKGAAADTQVN